MVGAVKLIDSAISVKAFGFNALDSVWNAGFELVQNAFDLVWNAGFELLRNAEFKNAFAGLDLIRNRRFPWNSLCRMSSCTAPWVSLTYIWFLPIK